MIAPDIDFILRRHACRGRDALIPILQEVQQAHGYLSREAIISIGRHLGLPTSKVYGIASSYSQFRFRAPGRFHVQVCRGTGCHVRGSARLLDAAADALGIAPGETSRDRLFSLEAVACLGACAVGPVLAVNGQVHARVGPDAVRRILDSYCVRAAADGPDAG